MNSVPYIKNAEAPQQDKSNPGFLKLFACKCPRCRKGDMYTEKNAWRLKKTMKMNEACPVCKQPFNIEVGFYYGAGYVSYALAVAFTVFTFVAWWMLVGFSYTDSRFSYWIVVNAVLLISLQPYLMRVARTGWLTFFVRYDANWKSNPPKEVERINKEQENNW